MIEEKNKNDSMQEYSFMSETIKRRPLHTGTPAQKVLLVSAGVLFIAACAFFAMNAADPELVKTTLSDAAETFSALEAWYNPETMNYLGIQGVTVSKEKAEELGIPMGVYVDTVECDSPAMEAGVQSGDIIYRLDDTKLKTVQEYTEELQELDSGSDVQLGVYRYNIDGEYESMELDITIEQR